MKKIRLPGTSTSLSALFSVLSVVFAVLCVLTLLLILIFAFMPSELESGNLFVYAADTGENGAAAYRMTLSDGTFFTVSPENIIQDNLKAPMYFLFLGLALGFAAAAVIFRLFSRLLSNIAKKLIWVSRNVSCFLYIGLTLLITMPLESLIFRLYDYFIIETMSLGAKAGVKLNINWSTLLFGLTVLFIGFIFKQILKENREEECSVINGDAAGNANSTDKNGEENA